MKMFLDDERLPPSNWTNYNFIVFRSVIEAKHFILETKCPSFISFDHDLGENVETGYDFAKWLVDKDLDNNGFIPADFTFDVHSMNPVGAKNIKDLLNQYLKNRG